MSENMEHMSPGRSWILMATAVGAGALWGVTVVSILESIDNGDDDPGTHRINDLAKVEFIVDGLQCHGLSPGDLDKVISSTVVCELVQE